MGKASMWNSGLSPHDRRRDLWLLEPRRPLISVASFNVNSRRGAPSTPIFPSRRKPAAVVMVHQAARSCLPAWPIPPSLPFFRPLPWSKHPRHTASWPPSQPSPHHHPKYRLPGSSNRPSELVHGARSVVCSSRGRAPPPPGSGLGRRRVAARSR